MFRQENGITEQFSALCSDHIFLGPGKDQSGGLEGAQTNASVKSFSTTRWRSIFGVQDLDQMRNILPFLSECEYTFSSAQHNHDGAYADNSYDLLKKVKANSTSLT